MPVTGISKQGSNPLPHRRIHLDERRPGALEAFAGEFVGDVEAELAAEPFQARVSAFSLIKRLRERKAAGLSNSKTVRNAANGDANQG